MANTFTGLYPNLARWVMRDGYFELGNEGMSPSFVRVLDEGGMIWEGDFANEAIDDALRSADTAIAEWMVEQGIG